MPTVMYPAYPVFDPATGEPLLTIRGEAGRVVQRGTETDLTLVDSNGLPMSQPLYVTDSGFLPTFGVVEGLTQVDFISGDVRMPITSPTGLEAAAAESAADADASRIAAEAAASLAQMPSDEAVDAGIARADIPAQVEAIHGDLITAKVAEQVAPAVNAATMGTLVPGVQRRRLPKHVVISQMNAGHAWSAGATTNATYVLDDTSDYAIGTRSASITMDGTGAGSGTLTRTGLALDFTGKGLLLWLKAVNVNAFNTISLTLGGTDSFAPNFFAAIPTPYGNKSPLVEGEWVPIYIPWGNMAVGNGTPSRSTITALRITVVGRSGGVLPILKLGGAAIYDDASVAYPNGVASFTFDDSYEAQATLAAPRLAQYGWSASLYPIISRIGTAGSLTLDQTRRLQDVYGWEIGTHASDNAAHVDWTTQTIGWVAEELKKQRLWQAENGFTSDAMAYPIGPFNAQIAREVARYYRSARSTLAWTNPTSQPHPHRTSCYVLASNITLAAAKTYVDRAVAGKSWVTFLLHDIKTASPTGNDWLLSDLEALLAYVATSGLAVDTVSNVIHRGQP